MTKMEYSDLIWNCHMNTHRSLIFWHHRICLFSYKVSELVSFFGESQNQNSTIIVQLAKLEGKD